MNIEVDTDELRNCEMIFSKNSISLEEEIKYWEAQIERLKNVWSGTEADIFYRRITSYLLKLKMIYETTNIFSKTIQKSYTMYEEKDKEFSSELRSENEQYDDEAFIRESKLKSSQLRGRRGVEGVAYIKAYDGTGGTISNGPTLSEKQYIGKGYTISRIDSENIPNVPNNM